MLRLRVLGSVVIERDGTAVAEIAELHKALALLALVAATGDRGISRDQIVAYLWPESDSVRARGALSQKLYTLRKQLDAPDLFAGTRRLTLNPSVVGSDLRDFELALERGDLEAAIGLYAGPFLDGLFVASCVEFERWIDAKRIDFAQRVAAAIALLARQAFEQEDYAAAVGLWRRLAMTEPGNSRAAAGLVEALAAAGDRAGALQVARTHEVFLRAEFDVPADPTVSTLAERIKRSAEPTGAHRPAEETPTHDVRGDVDVPNADGLVGSQPPVSQEGTKPVDARRYTLGRVPRRRAFQVAALFGLAASGIGIARLAGYAPKLDSNPMVSERRILVTPFRNETGDTSLTSIGRLAVDWLVQGLVQTQLMEVVAPGVREDGLPMLSTPDRLRNAGLVVRASYSRRVDSITFQAQVLQSTTGRVVRAVGPVSGPISEPLIAIERLRQQVAGALATRVDPRLSRWSDAASQPTSFEAYRAFDDGFTAFFSFDDSLNARAGELLIRAATLDSTFSLPLIWALYAFNGTDSVRFDSVFHALEARRKRLPSLDRAVFDSWVASGRGDAVGEYDALRRVVAIAPSSEWIVKLATAAADLRRWTEADSLLRAIDPDAGWLHDWSWYWHLRADVAYRLGNHNDELAMTLRATERFPRDGQNVRWTGRALAALGKTSEVLSLVDGASNSSPSRIDSEGMFRLISAARVHGHYDLAKALAKRALVRPVTGVDLGDSALTRVRFELLTFEAAEMWDDAVPSAMRMIRFSSLRNRHDALPYLVLLQAALRQGRTADTAGLEARARAEAAARPRTDDSHPWQSEIALVVELELAALYHDVPRARALLGQVVERGWSNYFSLSERPAYDAVRSDPAISKLIHDPTQDVVSILRER